MLVGQYAEDKNLHAKRASFSLIYFLFVRL